ncbi:MAG: DNA alkylation repair enzyme [candidate division WS6 bacterium OLB20]|uniref:DNA alkylation repair enzyme n=1 Tax=candidate division WS6 bacterium OLB20 TaxID=1617426 RepID=A0A136M0I6_9BACT|nr:MAG: DNA alkylation repair enzyme [candidate division WS6 bacterium OLB20]
MIRLRQNFFPRFFKTGPGQYGEGDTFIGVTVPNQRTVAKEFKELPLGEIRVLLNSPVHEHRLTALFILVLKFKAARKHPEERTKIKDFYLDNLDRVNNWDLVDSSAHEILGTWLTEQEDHSILYTLSESDNLWYQRVAVIATFPFIRRDDYRHTLALAGKLLHHKHDLIHKAVGWALRDLGKRDRSELLKFLDRHAGDMPRTMLRYAIEHLSDTQRAHYMKKQ